MTDTPPRSHESLERFRAPAQAAHKLSPQRGIVYGPVPSRRLGQSLGINLVPTDHKLCSFDCLYCQYGWSKDLSFSSGEPLNILPPADAVAAALETALMGLERGHKKIAAMTFCGNGEPTLYPALGEVITAAMQLRQRYQPQARLAMLSNSSTVGDAAVRAALSRLDLKIMKFDAGSEAMFRQLNHPAAPVYMGEIIAGLKQLNGCYLQSCFVQGRATNADPDSVAMWIEKVREIHPLAVHIHTLNREPTDQRIEPVSQTTLQWIANQVLWRAAVPAEVF